MCYRRQVFMPIPQVLKLQKSLGQVLIQTAYGILSVMRRMSTVEQMRCYNVYHMST